MGGSINNPHDKFFKFIVSNKEVAIAFLKTFLPVNIAKLIDFSSLTYEQDSYIDKNLQEYFSDVIFKFKLKLENLFVFINILIEHKSFPDKFTPVQILKYLANGYEKQLKRDKKLTLILPFIYYHGKDNWKYKKLNELIENLPEELHRYVPVHETVFIDLNRMSDKQLKGLNNMFLASALMMQKYSYNHQVLLVKFMEIVKNTQDEDFIEGNLFMDLLVIIFKVSQVDEELLMKSLKELPSHTKSKIMTLYQSIEQKGIQKGEHRKNINVILNGYKAGVSIKVLATLTNLSESEVIEIIQKYRK